MYDFLSFYFPYLVVASVGNASNVAQLADSEFTKSYFSHPVEFVTLIAFLGLIGFLFRWIKSSVESKISSLETRITRMDEQITVIHESHVDPASSPLKPRLLANALLLDEIRKLQKTIDFKCGNMNCPAVALVASRLDAQEKDISHRWDIIMAQTKEFYADGRKSRAETQELLQALFNRINGFVDGAGTRMLDFIEAMTQREENKKKRDER